MGLIPQEIIDQVIDRCDIVEIISDYVPLKRSGKNFKALSPFNNEKTPSFFVSSEKQIFHCFSTGTGGNVVSFIMKMERMDFPEAIRFLANKVGIEIPETKISGELKNIRQQIFEINKLAADYYHKILLSDKSVSINKAREYLKQRKVDLETVKKFQLGCALDRWDGLLEYLRGKNIALNLIEKAGLIIARENKEGYYDRFRNRIIFPILDTQGHNRAFGARALDKDESAKYINSPETPVYTKGQHLYGFNFAKNDIDENGSLIVVEGYFDCIMPHQAEVSNVVASLGTALTVEQIRLIRRYTRNIVMLFDSDKAGEAAMTRSLDLLIEEDMHVRVVSLEPGEDPDSYIRNYGSQKFKEKLNSSKSFFDYKLEKLILSFDAQSVEGKAKISAKMLETIGKFQNAIIQSEYVKQLAKALNISEQALNSELKKNFTVTESKKTEIKPQVSMNNEHVSVVEQNILKVIMEEESLVQETFNELSVLDFQDTKVRTVISKIYEHFEKGESIDPKNLINSFNDQALQEMISFLLAGDDTVKGDVRKVHQDCVRRLKNDRIKNKRQELQQQIKQAEKEGDHITLQELLKGLNDLVKKV